MSDEAIYPPIEPSSVEGARYVGRFRLVNKTWRDIHTGVVVKISSSVTGSFGCYETAIPDLFDVYIEARKEPQRSENPPDWKKWLKPTEAS